MSALVCGKRSQSTLFEDEFLSPLPSSKRIPCSAALHFSPPTSAVSSPQPPPIDHLRSFFPDMDQEAPVGKYTSLESILVNITMAMFLVHILQAPVEKYTSLESILVNITMAMFMVHILQGAEQLVNSQLRIHDQMIMLEGAKVATEIVDALTTGAAAMKAMQKAMGKKLQSIS